MEQTSSEQPTSEVLSSACLSDVGKQRHQNQDSYGLIEKPEFSFYAVADGMGGVKGGAIASQRAIQIVTEALEQETIIDEQVLNRAVQKANKAIFDEGSSNSALRGMGTTFVALAFVKSTVFVINVGDSRAYRFKNQELTQLTIDHTIAGELVRAGTITAEQARANPVGHMLSRSLGPSPDVMVDVYRCDEAAQTGDLFLLCSDGLYGQLPNEQIKFMIVNGLEQRQSLEEVLEDLIDECNHRGGPDNITGLFVQVGPSFPRSSKRTREARRTNALLQGMIPAAPNERLTALQLAHQEPERLESEDLSAELASSWFARLRERIVRQGEEYPFALIAMFCLGFGFGVGIFYDRHFLSRVFASTSLVSPIEKVVLENEVDQASEKFVGNQVAFSGEISSVELAAMGTTSDKVVSEEEDPEIARARLAVTREANMDPRVQIRMLSAEQDHLKREIEIATRKLSVWSSRQKRLANREFDAVANEVAVSSPSVQAKKLAYDQANFAYLKEAEVLVYNPADDRQEDRVSKLTIERSRKLEEFKQSVIQAVNKSNQTATDAISELSQRRDKVEARLKELKRAQLAH